MITRLVIILLLSSNLLIGQTDFLESDWVGRIELPGESHFVRVQFRDGKTFLQLPYRDGNLRYSLDNFTVKDDLPSFSIKQKISGLIFKVMKREGDHLDGVVDRNGLVGSFYLHRVLPIEEAQWQPYLGDYIGEAGLVFKVWDRFNTLRLHSPLSQEVGRMYRIGDHRFWVATGETLQFSDQEGSDFATVEWSWGEQRMSAQRRELYQKEDDLITTDRGDTIGVSLFVPKGEGPFPAVLIARGAANLDRSLNYMEAEILASYGIAALVYDNYGTGQTNGNPRTKDFEDKQDLVLDLYTHLQNYPKIKADQIGLMGGSQGARIAAMAASKAEQPAFLILRAHPMETRKDQQLYAIGAFLRQRNVTEELIVQILHLWEQYFDLAHRQVVDQEYIAAVNKMRAAHPDLMIPAAPANQAPPFPWRDDIYDATKRYLPNIHCPVLSEHGVEDDRVPPYKSVHFLETGLAAAGNDALTVIFYQNANHSFTMPGFRIAPGLFMNEVLWIKEVLGNR